MALRLVLLVVVGIILAGPAQAQRLERDLAAKYQEWSLPVPGPSRVIVCHGFGCKYRTEIGLGKSDQAKLMALLAPGKASAVAERRAIAQAIAWFQRRVAPEAGTAGAIARASVRQSGDPSQFDCIDSATNTTSYLVILVALGLLRHHSVDFPVSRHFFFDGTLHTTAVLSERGSGRRWAVDSWTRSNGEPPDVLPLDIWYRQT